MKKILLIILVVLLVAGGWFAMKFFGSTTGFEGKKKYLYVRTGMSYDELLVQMNRDTITKNPGLFDMVAARMKYPENVKAGKYAVEKGTSVVNLVRMLKNGQQEPVNFVITKLRTKEDFAALAGRKFEPDSADFSSFIYNSDTLSKYGLDTNTVMVAIIPDTYTYYWNISPSKVFSKLYANYKAFWTPERIEKAKAQGLTPAEAYTLASIVEEETNAVEEKGNIASVYLNRVKKGMNLGADPTVKYALRDFGLKRIYEKHLFVSSPYNTYRNRGLPPGPICTPSKSSVEAVLNAPQTEYLYFVVKRGSGGRHQFSKTYAEHLDYARQYHKALDSVMKNKKAADENLSN